MRLTLPPLSNRLLDLIEQGNELFTGPNSFPPEWMDAYEQWDLEVEEWWAQMKDVLNAETV